MKRILGLLGVMVLVSCASTGENRPMAGSPPQLVFSTVEDGQEGVSVGLSQIVLEFDRPMGKGYSITGDGNPEIVNLRWLSERKLLLEVKLEASKEYFLGLNSSSHRNLKSAEGVSFDPIIIRFVTSMNSKESD